MTFNQALYDHLVADTTLTALIGTRLYPLVAPELAVNAEVPNQVVYALEGLTYDDTLGTGRVFTNARYSFYCMSATYDVAHQIKDAVMARLHFFKGTMGTFNAETFQLTSASDVASEEWVMRGIFAVVVEMLLVYQ